MLGNKKKIKNIHCNSYIRIVFMTVFLSLITISCSNDPIVNGGAAVTPDGKVLLSLSVKAPSPDKVQTKSTAVEEDFIGSLDIVIFDADNKLSQAPASATFNSSAWKVALEPNQNLQNMYAIANLTTAQRAILTALPVGTTYDELRIALLSSDVSAAGVSSPFIMFSYVVQTSISPAMGAKTVEMTRAVAKIDVVVNEGLTTEDFVLESVVLLNAAKMYYPIPKILPDLLIGPDIIRYNEVVASGNRVVSSIYCYENNTTQQNSTQLLLKGRYKGALTSGFYKLNIVYNSADIPCYDIKRNFIYTVNITKVNNVGYNTAEEAISASASNGIESDIVVTDADARDILSNGSYYLGFSNSECIVYTSQAYNGEVIATFSHNAPTWIAKGTVSVQGEGLSLSGANPFTTPDGSVQKGDIRVNMSANFESGYVFVKLGNLQKTIKISRNTRQLSYGGAFNLGSNYIYARKLQKGPDTEWIKLAPNEDPSVGEDELDHPDGSIYMQLGINLTLLGGANRSCDLLCSRSNHEGRVMIKVTQYAFDIFETAGQINNAYIGTFHRWNQVGERVISMLNPGDQIWVATVAAGHDFINLEVGGSLDPNIYTSSAGDAENFPVTSGSTTIIGARNSPILFRVGLKTPLSSPDIQPRYGLILVTHAGGTNRIFVRQGEAADYIMRKSDPIDGVSSIAQADRPSAVCFSPFNLTDPYGTTGRVDLGDGRGGFVINPTIGGYHFQANKSYAWSPDIVNVPGNWTENNSLGTDPCPSGYRLPRDGVDGNSGLVEGSEMRQSLWYYPKKGIAESDYYNTIRGCLADGYFDRLPTTTSDVYGSNTYKAISVGSGIDAGFIGTIIFNPLTNASIFLPASGSRNQNNGALMYPGESTYWWSATFGSSRNVAWYGAMTFFNRVFTFDNYRSNSTNGFPIRCVKVANP